MLDHTADTLQPGTIAPRYDAKGRRRGTQAWTICPLCEKGRWVQSGSSRRPGHTGHCSRCHNKLRNNKGENNPAWKGEGISGKWYKNVMLEPSSPFFAMATSCGRKGRKSRAVREHRLVVAQHLGRCLLPWEIVHHKNGDKRDNRIENLELLPSQSSHLPSARVQAIIRRLEREVQRLQEELFEARSEKGEGLIGMILYTAGFLALTAGTVYVMLSM